MGFLCEDLHCTRPVQLCQHCCLSAIAGAGSGGGGTAAAAVAGVGSAASTGHLKEASIFLTMYVDVDGAGASKWWSGEARIATPATMRRSAERGVKLFFIGAAFALVLNLLQRQRGVIFFPPPVVGEVFQSAWWLLPTCGFAAALIGLLYPCIDGMLGEQHCYKREWSSVMRCVAVFVGINHASAKINFDNNMQLSFTLATLSIAMWWLFDRSRGGLGVGLAVAFLATVVIQVLVMCGVFWYSEPDFLYIRSWVPCIFFSGGVTVGTIGRQLAVADLEATTLQQLHGGTAVIKNHAE